MNNHFINELGRNIPDQLISEIGGFSYLSAGTVMAMAGLPAAEFANFDSQPYLSMLNGYVVAVDVPLPVGNAVQRMYLPVLDDANQPMVNPSLRDITDAQQRALVKAIAVVYGTGLSLFLGHDGKGEKSIKALKLDQLGTEGITLATLEPLVRRKDDNPEAAYVEWAAAVAAARASDPGFAWEIVHFNGLPYRRVLGGVLVDVQVTYQGRTFVQSLPVMDASFAPLDINRVTVFHWNTTVMRCLAKAIAFCTGYGLAVYGEGIAVPQSVGKPAASGKSKSSTAPAKASTSQEQKLAEGTKPSEGSAPASAEPAQPALDPVQQDIERFKLVMAGRQARGYAVESGLLSTFDALHNSVKFSAECKPACFALLVHCAVACLEPEHLDALLAELTKYNALSFVDQDSRALVQLRLIQVAVDQGLKHDDATLIGLLKGLVRAGVAPDSETLLALLPAAKVSVEAIELIKDLLTPEAA